MEEKKMFKVNKDYVTRLIKFKFGTIENYLKTFKISRMRLWQILNNPHIEKNVKSLQDLAKNLDVSIDSILL